MFHQNGLVRRNSAVEKRAMPTRTKLNSQNSGDELYESVFAVKTQCPDSGQWRSSCVRVLSCIWLCDLMDCNPPDSSVHGILQARILEWVAISSSRGSSQTRVQTKSPVSPALQVESLAIEAPGKPHFSYKHHIFIPRIFNKLISKKQVILTNELIL